MKRRKKGLTLIEMVVVLGIIAILVGLLIPAMTVVKHKAKEASQKAQFSAINLAMVTFKNDYGDYPPSNWSVNSLDPGRNYCGAQKLAEALLGWDLLGFHPKSAWRGDGLDSLNDSGTYDPLKVRDENTDGVLDTLTERKSRYIDIETANAFKLGDQRNGPGEENIDTGLFENIAPLYDTYVLCDVYKKQKIINPTGGKSELAGAPILYYRANSSMINIRDIYDVQDNDWIVYLKENEDPGDTRIRPLGDPADDYANFYNYIRDPKIETIATPYRRDSYILISAGLDGIYGTADDIRNFGN